MKLSIYSGLLCAMILISPAWSAKICLKEENNATCNITKQTGFEVTVTCGSMNFNFITACSAQTPSESEISESIQNQDYYSNACWAKMIYPKMSHWLGFRKVTLGATLLCFSNNVCSEKLVESINNIATENKYKAMIQIVNGNNSLPLIVEGNSSGYE